MRAESVTQLVLASVKLIGLLGAAFWLGVIWRRANAAGVWASFLGSLFIWAVMSADASSIADGGVGSALLGAAKALSLRGLSEPRQVVITLAVEFGLLVLVSLLTPPSSMSTLGPFYARLHTPVGKEDEVRWDSAPEDLPESATLGLDVVRLDYRKSSRFAYAGLQRLGLEVPRFTWFDGLGFVAAWALVGGLIGLLIWLSRLK